MDKDYTPNALAGLQASIDGMTRSLDRHLAMADEDRTRITELREQMKTVFTRLGNLDEMMRRQTDICASCKIPDASLIRSDEQAKAWRTTMDGRVASLEASREAVKAETLSAGKAFLMWLLKALGLGGGAVIVARVAQLLEHFGK